MRKVNKKKKNLELNKSFKNARKKGLNIVEEDTNTLELEIDDMVLQESEVGNDVMQAISTELENASPAVPVESSVISDFVLSPIYPPTLITKISSAISIFLLCISSSISLVLVNVPSSIFSHTSLSPE